MMKRIISERQLGQMATELTYDNLVEQLIARVPEILPAYEEDKEWMGDDYLPHIVFSFDLNPYIVAPLQSYEDDA